LSSKLVLPAARSCLYEKVVIKNCRELLCFVRTLSTTPSTRDLVRSFAWVGCLPEIEADATEFCNLASLLVDCYESIPRPLSLESTFIYRNLYLDRPGADKFRGWKVLGLVVFMLPNVRSLCTVLSKCIKPFASSGEAAAQLLADGGQPAHLDAHLSRLITSYEGRCFETIAVGLEDQILQDSYEQDTKLRNTHFLPTLENLMVDSQAFNAIRPSDRGTTIVRKCLPMCPRLRGIYVTGSFNIANLSCEWINRVRVSTGLTWPLVHEIALDGIEGTWWAFGYLPTIFPINVSTNFFL
jgi:hypothetical protein